MYLNIDKKDGNKIAIRDSKGVKATYGDIITVAGRIADLVVPRSVVFILNDNSTGAAVIYLACMINEIVPLIIGNSMDKDLLANLERIYEPAYICKPESKNESCVLLREFGYCITKTENEKYPIYPELALLLTTSGSTGSPKLVRHTYMNLESQGKNIAAFFEIKDNDRPLLDLPINYTYGLSVLNSYLYAGAEILITDLNVLSPSYWSFFKENEATCITGVPYTFEILKKLRFFKMDLPSLELITQGGGKLNDDLFREIAEFAKCTGRRFIPTYGQTEGTARMAYLPPELATEKCGSIGKAIPNGRMYLIDGDGKEILQTETEGELVYEGPNVTLGYAERKEDLLSGDDRKGVLYTGDMAKRDLDGCFYIIGRKKRFLKLNGYRVGLDECERLIRDRFKIECACTGDDKRMIIYITSDSDYDEIRKHISQKIGLNTAFFEVKYIDCIPRNEAGKILYSKL